MAIYQVPGLDDPNVLDDVEDPGKIKPVPRIPLDPRLQGADSLPTIKTQAIPVNPALAGADSLPSTDPQSGDFSGVAKDIEGIDYSSKGPNESTMQPIGSQQSATSGGSNLGSNLGSVASGIGGEVSQMGKDMSAASANEYQSDMSKWQGEEKYWFDPNSDVKPDLQKYMSRMPSQEAALNKGSMSNNTAGQILLNPLGKVGGVVGYLSDQGAQGAIAGAAKGSWVGAVVGAAIGVIKGIFSWSSASAADSKAKANALSDYTEAMKRWQINEKKRADAASIATSQMMEKKTEDKNDKQSQVNETKRSIMIKLINQMAAYKRPEYNMPIIGR